MCVCVCVYSCDGAWRQYQTRREFIFTVDIISLCVRPRLSLILFLRACGRDIYAERSEYIFKMHFPWKYRWRAREPNFFIMARVYIFIHISCKSFFSSALSPLFSSHCSIDRKTFNLGFSPRTARKICGKIFYIDKGSSR
jgi:hypothetical protein